MLCVVGGAAQLYVIYGSAYRILSGIFEPYARSIGKITRTNAILTVHDSSLTTEEIDMAHDVCPWWLGYMLASPLRKLRHNPALILSALSP